jgi:hypothetical protein
MKRSTRNTALFTFVVLLACASVVSANPDWKTFSAPEKGFSVDVPGEMKETKPDNYDLQLALWSFSVVVQTPGPLVLKLALEDRAAALKCLEGIRDAGMNGMEGKVKRSSAGSVNGYPSLRYTFEVTVEGIPAAATQLLVLTDQHLYMLMAFAPKAVPNPHSDRFLDSFRVMKSTTTAASSSAPLPVRTSSHPLGAMLVGPMLAVSRQLAIEESNADVDSLVQRAPPAQQLGNRWRPQHPAWPKARAAISSRIARLADYYVQSGDIVEIVDTAVSSLSKTDTDALVSTLKGSAGAAVLKAHATLVFVTEAHTGDPDNQPKIGSPEWQKQMRALHDKFDQLVAPALPKDDGTHKAEAEKHLSTEQGQKLTTLCSSISSRASTKLRGAIRLMVFDDREAIWRDIKAAIDTTK